MPLTNAQPHTPLKPARICAASLLPMLRDAETELLGSASGESLVEPCKLWQPKKHLRIQLSVWGQALRKV